MSEKQHLQSINELVIDNENQIRRYKTQILLAFMAVLGVALFIWINPNYFGYQVNSIANLVFFFFGMLAAKWNGLKRFEFMLPHIDKASIKKRLEELR
ncbi:hypothetical protein SOPP22_15005 [Shewanella sp. OPT22]|nr:hypothetical protein SOPP22_15005 [Shewanella sp. OPT22]